MGRAWLLVLLVVPAVAAAQAAPRPEPGQITYPTVVKTAIDGFINEAECRGGTIRLSWRPTTFGVGVSYQLYAANRTTTDDCPLFDQDKNDNSLRADPVGATITTEIREVMLDVEYSTSQIVGAAKKSCNTTADETIELCIQAKAGGANIGTARGTVTLSLAKPPAPTGVSASSGEQALNVSWDDAITTPASESFEIVATRFDPVSAATVEHSSGRVGTSPQRIEGLQNEVEYSVVVKAFSPADNESPPSAPPVSGTPHNVADFFEAYQVLGGQEQGGCASGAAGLLALAGVGFFLALRRRS